MKRGFAGTTHVRVSVVPTDPHPSYTVAPIALRRHDVTRFWETPEEQRQVLFRAFFQDPEQGSWVRLDEDEGGVSASGAAVSRQNAASFSTSS